MWIEKLDGSMIVSMVLPVKDKEDQYVIRFRTKMGFSTDVAQAAEKFVYGGGEKVYFSKEKNLCDVNIITCKKEYLLLCWKWYLKGYNVIFEFVSPNYQIVLRK